LALNKPESPLPILLTQQAVLFAKDVAEFANPSKEFSPTIVVMVNVRFNISDAIPLYLHQRRQQFGPTFFIRREKGFHGKLVGVKREPEIGFLPVPNASSA
jgi:hypothetical protein